MILEVTTYGHMRNARNTIFLALTLLFSKTHVGLTTLCWIHFQSVRPAWVSANKKVGVKSVFKECVHSTHHGHIAHTQISPLHQNHLSIIKMSLFDDANRKTHRSWWIVNYLLVTIKKVLKRTNLLIPTVTPYRLCNYHELNA